jgi:hypothetical protein
MLRESGRIPWAIEPAGNSSRPTVMAKLVGQLLFGIVRDLAEDQAKSILGRIVQQAGAWLDTKIRGRRLFAGLLIGFAAGALFPLIGLLLAR